MKEIKLRAWHRTNKAFMYFELGELNDSMITKVEDGWYLEDCEITLWIGRKDKNGKEIYQGDIIYIPYHGKCVVEFLEGSFIVSTMAGFECFFHKRLNGACEIIGNIYETPDP